MPGFKSGQFQTAQEKELVLGDWQSFLARLVPAMRRDTVSGCFSGRLYRHLINHCSYIAHYNRYGFIDSYFRDAEDTERFFRQFDSEEGYMSCEYGTDHWLSTDYSDINRAMCDAFESEKVRLYSALRQLSDS